MSGFSTYEKEQETQGLFEKIVEELITRQLLSTNEMFYWTKQIFEKRVRHILVANRIEYNATIQFLIALPYDVRIKPNFLFHIPLSNGLCSYSLKKVEYIDAYFPLDVPRYRPYFHKHHTVVEMSFTTADRIDQNNYQVFFDLLMKTFNVFVEAYKIHTGDPGIHYVNNQSVHFLSFWRKINVIEWHVEYGTSWLLNFNVSKARDNISTPELDEILLISHNILGDLQPYNLSEELLATSNHYANLGLFRESILYGQMSTESFVRTLFGEFLRFEGNTEAEIEAIQEETPFMSVIKKQLPKRLGGDWNVNSKRETSIGSWYAKAYCIRNRIIHAAFRPSITDAKEAFSAVEEFRRYVFQLMFMKENEYASIVRHFNKDYLKNF